MLEELHNFSSMLTSEMIRMGELSFCLKGSNCFMASLTSGSFLFSSFYRGVHSWPYLVIFLD